MTNRSTLAAVARPLTRDGLRDFFDTLPRPPRLLGLGEPTHGPQTVPRLRNEILRYLVEDAGFRSIAIESDCLAGLLVADYVATGKGDLDEVLARGISHGWGAYAANRELVEWLRDCDEDVRFYGFDAPTENMYARSPRGPLLYAYDYLAEVDPDLLPADRAEIDGLCGDDARWEDPAAAMEPALGVGSKPEAARLRVLADDLRAGLLLAAPSLIAATSADDWWRAELHVRMAARLLQYHAALAHDWPGRINRLMALRDAIMAENLLSIVEREARRGPTLVFAANAHLQRQISRWELAGPKLAWWSAGAIAATRLGDAYAFIATGLGTVPDREIGTPDPNTVEGQLTALDSDRLLLTGSALAASLADLAPRTGIPATAGYFPLDPAHLAEADGVAFLREAR
ncbi:erythromycin esterase-like protein [Hamadaea flava]|uniref:Erythromycin esterase family protein n=1 Tax=Hamadaea flava TaxID=1742688 RepID=A0ABV8LYW3_9ACTN|nr:erythromycin esterase family protein [Hamadaea flava]MCP2328925.1 erythromycin esterase-like protein [Hamadaea flava]